MSKHSRAANALHCQHGLEHDDCPHCALQRIRTAIPQLQDLVGAGRSSSVRDNDSRRGGTPSWEPIDVGALSLLQDIDRAGLRDLEQALADEERAATATRIVLQLDERCRRILGETFAPHTPLVPADDGSRGKPVACPAKACRGVLQVRREDDPRAADYGKPNHVQCSHRREHRWNLRDGGYLRLRVSLDEQRKATA